MDCFRHWRNTRKLSGRHATSLRARIFDANLFIVLLLGQKIAQRNCVNEAEIMDWATGLGIEELGPREAPHGSEQPRVNFDQRRL